MSVARLKSRATVEMLAAPVRREIGFYVSYAGQLHAIGIAEIEFRQIAAQRARSVAASVGTNIQLEDV